LPPGSSLVNLGVSGSRLEQALGQQLPRALSLQPDLVTVWLGVNDLNASVPLERYASQLETLLAGLTSTGATILVANVPDLTLLPAYRGVDHRALLAQVEAWNAAIAAVAQRYGVVVVDLRAYSREQAEHMEYVSADGFHPSAAGYRRIAELFWDALRARGRL
jgi:acyl-CoA thioesterase I